MQEIEELEKLQQRERELKRQLFARTRPLQNANETALPSDQIIYQSNQIQTVKYPMLQRSNSQIRLFQFDCYLTDIRYQVEPGFSIIRAFSQSKRAEITHL